MGQRTAVIIDSYSGAAALPRALRRFGDYVWRPGLGDALRPCVDQESIPALVVLSHPDEDVVRADYEALRTIEAADVFGLKEELQ